MGCPPASLVRFLFEGDRKAHASSDQKVGVMSTFWKDILISRGKHYPTGYVTGIRYALSSIMEWQELHIRTPGSLRTQSHGIYGTNLAAPYHRLLVPSTT